MHRDLLASRPDDHALVHTHASFAASLACLPAVQRDGIPARRPDSDLDWSVAAAATQRSATATGRRSQTANQSARHGIAR